jgi:hypothetical protein
MKKNLVPLLAVLTVSVAISLACATGGGVEPIVFDLSAPKTPPPTAAPVPGPTARSSPVSPAPTPEPAPSPAAARTEPAVQADTRSEPPPPQASSATASDRDPVRTVQARIDAFNRSDLAALAGIYASDARIYDPPDRVRDAGADGIRAALSRELAASPGGAIAVRDRVTQGAFVVERESRGGSSALVVYEVRSGRIANVWILR